MPEEIQPPEYPFPWMPLAIGEVEIVGWDGYSYVDRAGRTYWSGTAEPSEADALATVNNPPIENRKAGLLARAAQRRWEREVGGIELEGVTIRTDRESQAMLNGAITFCDLESQAVVNWKAANGWQQLGEMGLRAIALAVGRHVQACFSRERELGELITAATTHQQLDDIAAAIEAFDL